MCFDFRPTKLLPSTSITKIFMLHVGCQVWWRTTTYRKAWELQWPFWNVITMKAMRFSTTLSRTMKPGLPESHQEASSNPHIGDILGPPIRKFQADAEGAENHGYSFLGLRKRYLHEIPGESYCETLKKLPRGIHNRRQDVPTSGVCCTTIRYGTPPPIQARYSDSWIGKFFNPLHTVHTLHQVIITCFCTSRNFWPPRYKEWSRDKRRSARMAGRLGDYLFRRRYAKAVSTIRKVL